MAGIDLRKLGLVGLGAIAWALAMITTIFTLVDLAALSTTQSSILGPAIAAAILDLLASASLYVMIVPILRGNSHPWGPTTPRAVFLFICSAALAILACVLTLVLLVLLQIKHTPILMKVPDWWFGDMPTKFTLWALAVIVQLITYSLAWRARRSNRQSLHSSQCVDERNLTTPVVEDEGPSIILQAVVPPFTKSRHSDSPAMSRASSQSFESLRASVHQALRSPTSRSKLVGRPETPKKGSSVYSETSSLEKASGPDGFDNWDTSHVDRHMKDSVFRSTSASPNLGTGPFRSTALDTIPGSRPASPAKPLDGPFNEFGALPEDDHLPLSRPPPIFARADSPALSEEHIHPLFRTDSPTPPPATTPGTVITAAPGSGGVINRPTRPRASSATTSRTNSRAPSPSPLAHSRSFYIERPRDPSPPRRELTPPLPASPKP